MRIYRRNGLEQMAGHEDEVSAHAHPEHLLRPSDQYPVVSASSYPPPPTTSAYRWNSRWRGKKNQSLNTYKLSALLLIKKIPQERGRFSYFIQLQHWQCKRHPFFVSVRLFYGLTPIFWHTSNKRHKSGHFAFIMIAVPRNGYTFASKTRTERDKRQY